MLPAYREQMRDINSRCKKQVNGINIQGTQNLLLLLLLFFFSIFIRRDSKSNNKHLNALGDAFLRGVINFFSILHSMEM